MPCSKAGIMGRSLINRVPLTVGIIWAVVGTAAAEGVLLYLMRVSCVTSRWGILLAMMCLRVALTAMVQVVRKIEGPAVQIMQIMQIMLAMTLGIHLMEMGKLSPHFMGIWAVVAPLVICKDLVVVEEAPPVVVRRAALVGLYLVTF